MTQTPNAEGDASDRRRHVRMPVHWAGELAEGKESRDCVVLDISPAGARVQSADPLPAISSVKLTLAHGGDYEGAVVWQQGSFMGLAFSEPKTIAA